MGIEPGETARSAFKRSVPVMLAARTRILTTIHNAALDSTPAWQADAFPKVRHCYAQSVASGLSGVASGQAHHGIAWRAELGRSRCNDEAWQVGAIAAEDPGWLKGPLLYH
jgi:hypothetical protein